MASKMASASFGTSEELVFESPSVPEGEEKMPENKISFCKIIGSIENVHMVQNEILAAEMVPREPVLP